MASRSSRPPRSSRVETGHRHGHGPPAPQPRSGRAAIEPPPSATSNARSSTWEKLPKDVLGVIWRSCYCCIAGGRVCHFSYPLAWRAPPPLSTPADRISCGLAIVPDTTTQQVLF